MHRVKKYFFCSIAQRYAFAALRLPSFLLGIALFMLFESCHVKTKESEKQLVHPPMPHPETHGAMPFQKQTVVPSQISNRIAGLEYAYYLPAVFSDTVNLPLMIFFDPHGNGALPLKQYAGLAEKNHCILIGSNDSKNGMSLQEGLQIAAQLLEEADAVFHANQKRITLCGFSGGAKVALAAGSSNPAVSAVVYCGASQELTYTAHPLSLLGFAGRRDMNYSEIVAFQSSPALAHLPHYLIAWDGKHEWVDSAAFQYAFIHPFSAIPAAKLFTPSEEERKILAKEDEEKQYYLKSFTDKDITWWSTEIARLNRTKVSSASSERLLGFISLACYTLGKQLLTQNNLPAAKKILSIYRLADPENQDMEQMWSEYKQKAGY